MIFVWLAASDTSWLGRRFWLSSFVVSTLELAMDMEWTDTFCKIYSSKILIRIGVFSSLLLFLLRPS